MTSAEPCPWKRFNLPEFRRSENSTQILASLSFVLCTLWSTLSIMSMEATDAQAIMTSTTMPASTKSQVSTGPTTTGSEAEKRDQGPISRVIDYISNARRLSKAPQPANIKLVLSAPPVGVDPKFKIRAVARTNGRSRVIMDLTIIILMRW